MLGVTILSFDVGGRLAVSDDEITTRVGLLGRGGGARSGGGGGGGGGIGQNEITAELFIGRTADDEALRLFVRVQIVQYEMGAGVRVFVVVGAGAFWAKNIAGLRSVGFAVGGNDEVLRLLAVVQYDVVLT